MDTFVGLDQALLIICGVGVLLCFLAFIRLRRHVFTGLIAVLLSLSFTGAAVVITKDVYSYRHLADEQLVARIFVAGKAKQQYIVSVDTVNEDHLTDVSDHGRSVAIRQQGDSLEAANRAPWF